ncbi:MAG: HAD-IC family P-type ATPase, partial [Steroidobacteraceae bacterium]|nr:HAD-IC family P-type ATPase [Steroidobacteraceae bacterium]MDW8258564.1 HAD-IC family P-type ATPase [Gammaproteobacteria bacterium]
MSTVASYPGSHWLALGRDTAQAILELPAMHCAGCVRRVEQTLRALPGVQRIDINLVERRVGIEFAPSTLRFEQILQRLASAGFPAQPASSAEAALQSRAERRHALKRIGLAALGSTQLMMYTVGLYAGAWSGIDRDLDLLLRWTCAFVTLPVLLYSGGGILQGAWRELRARAPAMDLAVAVALVLAYGASLLNTARGSGAVYYESVAMFVLLLLLARYGELTMRQRSRTAQESLAASQPAFARRLDHSGAVAQVPLAAVRPEDILQVAAGEPIPVDGELLDETALVDEAMLTGESEPLRKKRGDPLLAGAINLAGPLRLRAQRRADASTLQQLVRLQQRAAASRPRLARLADRVAVHFTTGLLITAALVYLLWRWLDPSRAFEAALATLVVACPCALALAMPTALAAGMARLARLGIIATRADALETLARVTKVVFDKTGTLTSRRAEIDDAVSLDGRPIAEHRTIAAALERGSVHPLARAFAADDTPSLAVSDAREWPGDGIEATVGVRRYRIGRREFVAALVG